MPRIVAASAGSNHTIVVKEVNVGSQGNITTNTDNSMGVDSAVGQIVLQQDGTRFGQLIKSGNDLSISSDSGLVKVADDLNVAGNVSIDDNVIQIGNGSDSSMGMVFNRAGGTNAAFIWDETNDRFILGTSSITGDSTGSLTVTPGSVAANLVGNAATATTLETGRNIGGVSFDGSSDISLPGVNATGNQDTSGNAATATTLETARNIAGVSFDGSSDITLNIGNLSNVSSTGPSTGQVLKWSGSEWAPAADATGGSLALSDLTNVSSTGPSTGQVLKWTGSEWAPGADATGSGGSGLALTDLTVVESGTGPGSLQYNNVTGQFTFTKATVSVAHGGTGATSDSDARTNLGLVIGTDVQAYDAELAALAG